jgi:CO dehydrogenase/acetyl-CoA synthase gamma subunit (corrinoid Fe-S protein)
MSHEKSVTLNIEDFWFNAPSIHKGKSYTEDQVRDMILNKKIKPTSIHKSHINAMKAARKRSASFDKSLGGEVVVGKNVDRSLL